MGLIAGSTPVCISGNQSDIITGRPEPATQAAGLDADALAFLSKPVDDEAFLSSVRGRFGNEELSELCPWSPNLPLFDWNSLLEHLVLWPISQNLRSGSLGNLFQRPRLSGR